MPPSPNYDVAVVGAGPAGARTAEVLAQRGLHVALIERDPVPGIPVHCTGIVSAECFERYALPQSLVVRSVDSFVLRSPSGRGAEMRRDRTQAYVLDRPAMDRELVERAVRAGAELLTSIAVDDVRWDGRAVRLTGVTGDAVWRFDARAAVLATGFGSKLPGKAGFTLPKEVVSGCQAIVEAEALDEVQVYTGNAYGDGGFGWTVPWKPGYALTGLVTRRDTMSHLSGHVGRLQQAGTIGTVVDMYRCRAIPLRLADRSVADGILGVGDAVGQVKPTSGGGIYFGLLGADAAAAVLADALEAGDVSAARLASYERRWRAVLESEIRQGYALRRMLEQLPDSVIEHFHRLLGVPGLKRLASSAAPSFDWHSGPLTRFIATLQRQAEAFLPSAS